VGSVLGNAKEPGRQAGVGLEAPADGGAAPSRSIAITAAATQENTTVNVLVFAMTDIRLMSTQHQ
jgi:hypothetical protein